MPDRPEAEASRESKSEAERKVLAAAAAGEPCRLGRNDPAAGEGWGEERQVDARLIYDLCCGAGPERPVHAKGVRIEGARILGELDFADATLRVPLHLVSCSFERPLVLERARARHVALTGSHLPGLRGEQARIAGSLLLDLGFTATGAVQLWDATIDGDLDCRGGRFELAGKKPGGASDDAAPDAQAALDATWLRCGGSVLLGANEKQEPRERFSAVGLVNFTGATVRCDFDCSGGRFSNPGETALLAAQLECRGDVALGRDFSAAGEVVLLGAAIGGDFNCTGGTFENPSGDALQADHLTCKGEVLLDGPEPKAWRRFSARGTVRLAGATVGGNVDCTNGSFEKRAPEDSPGGTSGDEDSPAEGAAGGEAPELWALMADNLDCRRNLFLRGEFRARGEVRLLGAAIGQGLECGGGRFENPEGDALSADNLECRGNVFLSGEFLGTVRLLGADVSGNIDCGGGTFENPLAENALTDELGGDLAVRGPEYAALLVGDIDCRGNVYLRGGFRALGKVSFLGATIRRDLELSDVSLDNPAGYALDLTDARVRTLLDEEGSWPEKDRLLLDGFRYSAIDPLEVGRRKKWLRRAKFRNQPYAQLAAVLSEHGRSEEAKEILIEQQRQRRRWLRMHEKSWAETRAMLWLYLIGPTLGFGYRPTRALWALLAFFLFGWAVFADASRQGVMAPSSALAASSADWREDRKLDGEHADYPRFSALVYSLDTLMPVIDLGVESRWHPGRARRAAREPRIGGMRLAPLASRYLPVHIALGWILSTLAVVGFTGLVRPV